MQTSGIHDAKPHDVIPTSTAIAASMIAKSMVYRVGKTNVGVRTSCCQ